MMIEETNRLVLGTAQLGMNYGVANTHGQPNISTARSLVKEAWKNGVRYFDTAQAYGESEAVLGDTLQFAGIESDARIISKTDPSVDVQDFSALKESVDGSLDRLKVDQLWGIMLHREEQLIHWDVAIKEAFSCLRSEGRILHAGVSVYSPEMAFRALNLDGIDIIQVPASLLDRRFTRSGFFEQAAKKGVTVFVRSVFLQGVTMMASSTAAVVLPIALPAVKALESFCQQYHYDRHEFALRYALAIDPAIKVLVGVENADQIESNCRCMRLGALEADVCEKWNEFWPHDDEVLVNPSLWPKRK